MTRLLLLALLLAAPVIAQDTTAARTGGRGAGRGGGGRGQNGPPQWSGSIDTVRARQLYVSKDPQDLRGCVPAVCERGLAGKRRTDSVYTAKAPGRYEFQKIRYKSRADGLEIPAYLFSPIAKGTAKHAALVWVHGGVHGDWDTGMFPSCSRRTIAGALAMATSG
jgi:dipeptidyl aminopeptidase/acylaminoacyl peptidase